MNEANESLTAIDLFCGAGGLTLGLKRAGFNVVAAVEISPEIAKTYRANHPATKLLVRDVREVTGDEILELTGLQEIDLVAGCPPCQGFSKLTDKYHRKDPRNDLVLEMARLIEQIAPKAVMMENVPGLAIRGRPVLARFVSRLESKGYLVNSDVLQLADYGVPQSRRRFVLLAGKGFSIQLPERTHCRKGDKERKLRPWLTLGDIVRDMPEPVTLSEAKELASPQAFGWHVVRDLKEISLERLRSLEPGSGRSSLPKELRPKCHVGTNEGFPNVYGRLSWDQTPPTVTSGCTTPAMGRFGHPDRLGTISVREAALIQTLPRHYELATDMICVACDLVGNALPPDFAEKAAGQCKRGLRAHRGGCH